MADNGVSVRAESINNGPQKRTRDTQAEEPAVVARDGRIDVDGNIQATLFLTCRRRQRRRSNASR